MKKVTPKGLPTPLQDRIIVKPDDVQKVTTGGILIPDNVKEKIQKGTVIAAGEGMKDEPMMLKKDDNILFQKHSGTEINIEGISYLIMRETDVLAII